MIEERLIKLVSEIVDIGEEDISEKTKLTKESGIEPIDVARIVIAAEKEFDITIHDEYISNFTKIDDIIIYIENEIQSY